jgi:DnaK suppressor protein
VKARSGDAASRSKGEESQETARKHAAVSAADLLGLGTAPKRPKKKTKARIPKQNAARWAQYLERLENLRDRIESSMNHIVADHLKESKQGNSAGQGGMDEGDVGSRSTDQDLALGLVSNSQELLYEVEDAIQRIREGEFGSCEICSEEIPSARLEALPYARMCVRCKAERERRPSAMNALRRSSREQAESS